MKILVGAKRVVDSNIKVRVNESFSNVDIVHSKMALNPFDENSIEETVRLKEKGLVSEIVVLSIGNEKSQETLRTALARGADRAILVETEENLDPINIAKIFKCIVKLENPDLVILGKQAIDDDSNQVGQMLAGMLDYPQATFVSKIELFNNKLIVDREIDDGIETLEIILPAVITVDLIINKPRFIKLPQLMLAKKKPINIINLSNLNLNLNKSAQILKAQDGEQKKLCKFVNSIEEIIEILKEKKVI